MQADGSRARLRVTGRIDFLPASHNPGPSSRRNPRANFGIGDSLACRRTHARFTKDGRHSSELPGVGLRCQRQRGAIVETDMSATGLDVFDKTLQTTNIWLDQIMRELGPDRQVAWHALGAVLHALRDRLQVGLAVHLGAQLPLLVRGLYYDQWHPSEQALKQRSAQAFLDHVSQRLAGIRPVNVKDATHVTLQVLNHYLDPHQVDKVRQALPESVRALWP